MSEEGPVPTQLRVGNVVRRTFGLAGRNGPILFLLAGLGLVLIKAVDLLAFGTDPSLFMPAPVRHAPFDLLRTLQEAPEQFINFAVGAALIWIVYADLKGLKISLRESVAAWSRALVPLVLMQFILSCLKWVAVPIEYLISMHLSTLVTIVAGVVMLAWVVVLIPVLLGLWLVEPAIIIEGQGPIAALRRSWMLVSGHRFEIFCVGFILAVYTVVPMWAAWLISGVGIPPSTALHLWTPIGGLSLLLEIALSVLMATATAVIYSDLRTITERPPKSEL
jgi:hypothetical protein